MSVQHVQMGNAADMTTGIKREQAVQIPWSAITAMKGVQRAKLLHDLERFGLLAQARVDPDLLRNWKKGATGLSFNPGEMYGEYWLTEEWVNMPVGAAMLLDVRKNEDPVLGAATMRGVMISDGYGGKMHAEENVPAAPRDMIQIRMAHEGRLVIATS